jgi:hypothetical protein
MVDTRLSDDAQTLLNMNHAVNTSSLCRDGKWLIEDDAIKSLNINKQTISLYRTGTACPLNIHVAHGQKCHAPEPYGRCLFLYITAEGTSAMKHSISLIDWSRMCQYFSNDDNINTANNNSNNTTANNGALFCHLFEKYTGVTATPYNIRRAIADGVIKQSTDLQNVVSNRKGRPSKLKSNNNNTTARQQQKRNLADVLLPSTSKLTSIVVDRVTSLGSDDKLIESDDDLSLIAGIMKLKKLEKIQFEAKDARGKTKQMIFSICQVCNNHRVCEMRKNMSSHCRKCGLRQASIKRRDKRRQENSDARTATDSRTTFSNLTTAEITKRVSGLRQAKKRNAAQAKKLQSPKKKLAKVAKTAAPNSTPSETVQSYEVMYNEAVEKHKMDTLKLMKESAAKGEGSVSVDAMGEARNIAAMQRASILKHNGKQGTSHRNDVEVHAALSQAENDAVQLYIADAQKKKEEAALSK